MSQSAAPPHPYRQLSDNQIVSLLSSNNSDAIVWFFYERCWPIFQYHVYKLFPQGQDVEELVNEFYLHMSQDNWHRLKTFNGSSKLTTWISVVSYRFFRNFKHSKIDSAGLITINDKWKSFVGDWVQESDAGMSMDISSALAEIPSERDRVIARELIVEDKAPQTVAKRFGLGVDYIYTIKNRIIKRIKERLKSYSDD